MRAKIFDFSPDWHFVWHFAAMQSSPRWPSVAVSCARRSDVGGLKNLCVPHQAASFPTLHGRWCRSRVLAAVEAAVRTTYARLLSTEANKGADSSPTPSRRFHPFVSCAAEGTCLPPTRMGLILSPNVSSFREFCSIASEETASSSVSSSLLLC